MLLGRYMLTRIVLAVAAHKERIVQVAPGINNRRGKAQPCYPR